MSSLETCLNERTKLVGRTHMRVMRLLSILLLHSHINPDGGKVKLNSCLADKELL